MLPVLDTITRHLARQEGITRVVLYGSRARGDHQARSDIDLAIESTDDRAMREAWAYLMHDAPTLLRIDVTDLGRAPAALRERIERDGVTIYERAAS